MLVEIVINPHVPQFGSTPTAKHLQDSKAREVYF